MVRKVSKRKRKSRQMVVLERARSEIVALRRANSQLAEELGNAEERCESSAKALRESQAKLREAEHQIAQQRQQVDSLFNTLAEERRELGQQETILEVLVDRIQQLETNYRLVVGRQNFEGHS